MTVKRVKTRSVSAEAVEHDGANYDEIAEFVPGHVRRGPAGETEVESGSHPGTYHQLHVGDHVFRHADGTHHVSGAAPYHKVWEDDEAEAEAAAE